MVNREIQATWYYHNGTKHPHGNLMDPRHSFDPSSQPLLFKIYPDLDPIPLPLPFEASPSVVPSVVRYPRSPWRLFPQSVTEHWISPP